jgi:EDD domain protein, degV family
MKGEFMAKTAIVTDSNSGITQAEGKEAGIFVLPMPFLIDGNPYLEDIDLTQSEFYKHLEKKDTSVSTSQPSIGDLSDFWNDILKTHDEILHIPMSSGLSQSCATATALAKDFGGKVHVVNNQRISITQKESVFDAKKLLERGKNAAEIKDYLEATKLDSSIYIAVDTMKYLKKGGRVTPAAAAIGSILKIKPVLQIQGDKLDKFALARSLSKAKEIMKEAIRKDLNVRFKSLVEEGEMTISVAHTNNYGEADIFVTELKEMFPDIPFRFSDPLSLSVACHIGPGALAVGCTRIVK